MTSSVCRGLAAAARTPSNRRCLMDSARETAFLVEYLYKSRRDICEGFRQLEGDELREHLLHVLSLVIRVAGLAIEAAAVAARYVSPLSNALHKFNLGVGTYAALVALLALALPLLALLVTALSGGSWKAVEAAGRAVDIGSVVPEVAKMIHVALTDVWKRSII